MFSGLVIKNYTQSLLCCTLHHKTNKKYKKLLPKNKKIKLYNPRQELQPNNKIIIKQQKFYTI